MPVKYYRHKSNYRGLHYFKVKDDNPEGFATKVTMGHCVKKGRAYSVGITFIRHTSFVGSYRWMLGRNLENNELIEISKDEYESAFNIVMKKLK